MSVLPRRRRADVDAVSNGESVRVRSLPPLDWKAAALLSANAAPMVASMFLPAYQNVLVCAWLATFVVTTSLVGSAVKVHRRDQEVEAAVRKATNRLTTAATADDMYVVALSAIEAILAGTSEAVATFVRLERSAWVPVASTDTTTDGMRSRWRLQMVIDAAKAAGNGVEGLEVSRQFKPSEKEAFFHPLMALGSIHGALVVESAELLEARVVDQLTAAATYLSFALQASTVTDDLVRQRGDKRYRSLVENSRDAIFVVERSGRTLFATGTAERMLEAADGAADILQAVHPKDRAAFTSLVHGAARDAHFTEKVQSLECRLRGSEENPRWIEADCVDLSRDPDVEGVVVRVRDITDKKLVERDLRHRVLHDELTGISNRELLEERVDHALQMRRSDDSVAALLYIDLNEFHVVNDAYGRATGDELLKVVAFRIDNFVRGHDTAARLSADEFGVLLQDVASNEDIHRIAQRLLKVVQMPLEFNGRELTPKARVGVCIAQPDYDAGVFLRNAEVAVQEAKLTPEQIAVFSESMSLSAVERMDFRRELALAVERDELAVYYQPIFDISTNRLCSFEALIRWDHPERGVVSPGMFIPLAEETGLIVPIGAWVMYRACRQLAVWRLRQPAIDLHMSINVSGQQLMDDGFVETVKRIIRQTGVEPHALVLELTEADHLKKRDVRDRLEQVRRLGVGLAADDFGSGFASYSALQELPFTVAKIDRTLVGNLATNFQKASSQLRSVIEVAHSANLLVCAEGIEDRAQLDVLASLGCDRGQGWFFGKPMPTPDADRMVKEAEQASEPASV